MHAQRAEAHRDPEFQGEAPPDLVRRDFTGPAPTYRPVDDITYLRTDGGGCTSRRPST